MDSNVPKSQSPPDQNTGETQPLIDLDDEMEHRHLWEVQNPDLSVLHSMPSVEPFSHEGNDLFVLLEQSKKQLASSSTLPRSRSDNAAGVVRNPVLSVHSMPSVEPFSHEGNALFELIERSNEQLASTSTLPRSRSDNAAGFQWQLPPQPLLPTGYITSTSNTMATSRLPAPLTTAGRIISGTAPAVRAPLTALPPPWPTGTSASSVSPFFPNYSGTRRYTDFSAGSSSSFPRDDKGKAVMIERSSPHPSRVPSVRQLDWHLFDHNAQITGDATRSNPTSGDHGRLVHWSQRDGSNQNIRPKTTHGASVNNSWLYPNQISTGMESNYEFSNVGQQGFTDNQERLQNPLLYDGRNQNWSTGLLRSDIGNDLLRDGNTSEFPGAGHGNVDPSQLGQPHPTDATTRDSFHLHYEMQQGGAGGPNPEQVPGNRPYWFSGHPDESVNRTEVNNHQTIEELGLGFNDPLLYSIPRHPDCDSCNVLRQASHSHGVETRIIEVHRTQSGIFHIVGSVMYTPYGNPSVLEFLFDHYFHSFLVVESFLDSYLKSQEEANGNLVQDEISNYYTALRIQWLFDEQEPAPQPLEPPLEQEAPPETSPTSSDSTTLTGTVSEGTTPTVPLPRLNISEQRRRTGRMKLQDIQEFMHFPLAEAATKLEVCSTVLKKISRKFGIRRWPYRKIKAIDRTLSGLERSRDPNATEPDENIEAEIRRLKEIKEKLRNGKNPRSPPPPPPPPKE